MPAANEEKSGGGYIGAHRHRDHGGGHGNEPDLMLRRWYLLFCPILAANQVKETKRDKPRRSHTNYTS